MFGATEIKVNGNIDLIYSDKSFFRKKDIPISLDLLDPKPYSFKEIPIKSLFIAFVFALIATLFLYGYFNADSNTKPVLMFFFIAVSIITGLSIVGVINNSANYLVFTNKNNGANVFLISPKSPSKNDVDIFVEELRKRIDSIRYPENIPIHQMKEIYLKHIEFLREQEVLNDDEVNTLVSRLEKKTGKADVIKIV